MGEKAQACLEELIPVFEQCQRVGLFSPVEVKTVIKTCNKHEYKMNKSMKTSTKDAVSYAQYLEKFLKLVVKRRAKIEFQAKKTEIDFAICRKVDGTYRIACERFQSHLPTWIARIKFAKSRNMKSTVSSTYIRMLQVHSGKVGLWIQAAKWELEDNKSVENARNLLQKGLRFHSKTSNKLWIELFKLELLYVQKLIQRKELLQVKNDKDSATVEDNMEDETNDAVMNLQLAKIVAQQSVEDRPNADLYMGLLNVANEFPFAKNLSDWLYESLANQFAGSEDVWMVKLRRKVDTTKQEVRERKTNSKEIDSMFASSAETDLVEIDKAAFDVIDQALAAIDTQKMYTLCLQFCTQLVQIESDLIPENVVKGRKEKMENLYKIMDDRKFLEEADYVLWANMSDGCKNRILDVGLTRYPKSCEMWLAKIQSATVDDATDQKTVFKLFNKAVKNVCEAESVELWEFAIQWAAIYCPEQVQTLFKGASSRCSSVSKRVREMQIDWLACSCLPDLILIESISPLINTRPNSLEFYGKLVELLKVCSAPPIKMIRTAFESALSEYAHASPQIWIDYALFEMSFPQADPTQASKIYERAVKRLEAPAVDEFIRLWTVMNSRK